MNDKAIAVHPTPVGLVLFAPAGKGERSSPGVTQLRVNPEVKSPVIGGVQRRLPISVWQIHSWSKRIVERQPCNGVEKARILRPRRT